VRKVRRSKEQAQAEHEAQLKVLEEKMHAVQVAKEQLAQMNLIEESEGNLPIRLSIKRCHVEVDTDSDECFDIRDAANSSDLDSSSESESDKATKTKSVTKVCCIYIRLSLVIYTNSSPSVKNASRAQFVKNF
jgi:hypothetical protein